MRLRMKIAMKKANLTIRETAEKIGCCKATLGSDTKKQDTKASTIFKFCQVTNCDANWLLGLTKEYKKLKE